MKKTILTLSLAFLFLGNGLMASETQSNFKFATETGVTEVELSSFCKAVMQGDIDMVKRMIELGEDVNKKSLGMTPVMYAARYNKAEVLQILIDHGANLRIKSNQGYSVQKYAELSNATDALAVLDSALGS
ncbi:MAG: ankyrin repeat domain-containing protein [Maribacter sp.]|jgi:ankyrin repeat protein